MTGTDRPRHIIFEADEPAASGRKDGTTATAGLAMAAALVIGVVMAGWLDGGGGSGDRAMPPPQVLADRDYRRLPASLRACFTRIGNRDDWQMLDRCRARLITLAGDAP